MSASSAPNWLGLLRWSMAVNDGTAPSEFSSMSAEDKAWLETVMTEVVRSDPQRMDEVMLQVKELLEKLSNNEQITEEKEEKLLIELEDLRDIVEQVDMAQVFAKFGGCDVLLHVAEHDNCVASIRSLCVAIIGTVAQNNLVVQDALYQSGLLHRLCQLLTHVGGLPSLCKKVMFAVSATVRGHAAAEEHFALQELTLVARALLPIPALRAKLYFLASALVESDYCSEVRTVAVTRALLTSLLSMTPPSSGDDNNEEDPNEMESTEFGLVLLRDLLQSRIGQKLLLSASTVNTNVGVVDVSPADDAPSTTATEEEAPAVESDPEQYVKTSLTYLQSLSLHERFVMLLQSWSNNVPQDSHVAHSQWQNLRRLVYEDPTTGTRLKHILPVKYPRSPAGQGGITPNVTTTFSSSTTDGPPAVAAPAVAEEMLLIAPPPLEAAHRAP